MVILFPTGTARREPKICYGTLLLVTVNIVVFVLAVCSQRGLAGVIEEWSFQARSADVLHVFSSTFLHAGLFHLVANMVFLFVFGAAVEDKVGTVPFLVGYVLCGLGAGFIFALVATAYLPGQAAIPCVGASGAIFGVLGYYLVSCWGQEVTFFYFIWIVIFFMKKGTFQLSALTTVLLYGATDLVLGIVQLQEGIAGGGTAHWAHVGGLACGLLLALLLHDEAEEKAAPTVARHQTNPALDPRLRSYLADYETEGCAWSCTASPSVSARSPRKGPSRLLQRLEAARALETATPAGSR